MKIHDLVEVYRIEVEPGGIYVSGSHGEKTREYLVVTEGVLTVECHGQSCQIRKDQVFKFETDQDHVYRNESGRKRPAVPASSLIITENSDKEAEWKNKQNVITYRNKMYNIMHKRKLHNISLKYKKSFKINKNLFGKKSIDK